MQTPKIKLIKMYVVVATTLGAMNHVQAGPAPCDLSASPSSCTTISQLSSSADDSVYMALKWTFGDSIKPEALLGFRHAEINSSGDTDGADLSISAKFIDNLEIGKLRAKYFNGKENVQGEISAGYDFNKGLFTGIGVHAPYTNLGIDLLPTAKDKFEPYLQIDTIKGNDKPAPKEIIVYPPG
jgi:hypothetical protein